MRAKYCHHHVRIKQQLLDSACDRTYRDALEDQCRIALMRYLLGKGGLAFDQLGAEELCRRVENTSKHELDALSIQGFFSAFDNGHREASALLCCAVAIEMGEEDVTFLYELLMDEKQCVFAQLPGVVKRSQWSRSLSEFLSQNMPLLKASV